MAQQFNLGSAPQIQATGSIQSNPLQLSQSNADPVDHLLTGQGVALGNPYANYLDILKEQAAVEKSQIANERQSEYNRSLLNLPPHLQHLITAPPETAKPLQAQYEYDTRQKKLRAISEYIKQPDATEFGLDALVSDLGDKEPPAGIEDARAQIAAREVSEPLKLLVALRSGASPREITSMISGFKGLTEEDKTSFLEKYNENPKNLDPLLQNIFSSSPQKAKLATDALARLKLDEELKQSKSKTGQEAEILATKRFENFTTLSSKLYQQLTGVFKTGGDPTKQLDYLVEQSPEELKGQMGELRNLILQTPANKRTALWEQMQPGIALAASVTKTDISVKQAQAYLASQQGKYAGEQATQLNIFNKAVKEAERKGESPPFISPADRVDKLKVYTDQAVKAATPVVSVQNSVFSLLGAPNSESRTKAFAKYTKPGDNSSDAVIIALAKTALSNGVDLGIDQNIFNEFENLIASGKGMGDNARKQVVQAIISKSDDAYNRGMASAIDSAKGENVYISNSLPNTYSAMGIKNIEQLGKGNIVQNPNNRNYEVYKDGVFGSFGTREAAVKFAKGETKVAQTNPAQTNAARKDVIETKVLNGVEYYKDSNNEWFIKE